MENNKKEPTLFHALALILAGLLMMFDHFKWQILSVILAIILIFKIFF